MQDVRYASGRELPTEFSAILVPVAIFVNSQLYAKIQSNDISYLQGSDTSDANEAGMRSKVSK